LAEFLGFPQEDCNIISQAALVQDLGLLAMPESMRQHGGPPPLEQTQLSLFHQHPMIAYHWLQEHNFPLLLAQIVRQRHEHYDGKGYPDGLNGEQIILGAGIVAVATAFENMLTGTIDKEITASVCERLKSMVGTRFASLPVEALENITQKM
jgi:response regulator RpfG family c-di-GMP phosphodiesterase